MDRACPSNESAAIPVTCPLKLLVGYKTKKLHRNTSPLIDESAAGEGILIRQDHSRAVAQATGAWSGRMASRKACHDGEGRRLRRNESSSLRACAFRTAAEGTRRFGGHGCRRTARVRHGTMFQVQQVGTSPLRHADRQVEVSPAPVLCALRPRCNEHVLRSN